MISKENRLNNTSAMITYAERYENRFGIRNNQNKKFNYINKQFSEKIQL
jgi:hypothetical protein